MQSTRTGAPARWLGVDLSDRYAPEPRANQVCGLDPVDGRLAARFWTWSWDAPGAALEVAAPLDDVRATRCALLDGPQCLARAGHAARACEVAFDTPWRTPDRLPAPDGSAAGAQRSSVELFAAFFAARVRVSPVAVTGGVGEVAPGALWRGLERFGLARLPEKASEPGRRARRAVLEALDVYFGALELPTQDQLDACLAAVTAAAADGGVRGVHARARGDGVFRTEDGLLREGPIVELSLQGFRVEACRDAVEALSAPAAEPPVAVSIEGASREPAPRATNAPSPPSASEPDLPSEPLDPAVAVRAEELFDLLLARFERHRPLVVTYAAAHALLFPAGGRPAARWSPDLARQVLAAAAATSRRELSGLGAVALDAFVVDSTLRTPGRGHWPTAGYTVEAWRACFGLPDVAEPGQLRLERAARSL